MMLWHLDSGTVSKCHCGAGQRPRAKRFKAIWLREIASLRSQ